MKLDFAPEILDRLSTIVVPRTARRMVVSAVLAFCFLAIATPLVVGFFFATPAAIDTALNRSIVSGAWWIIGLVVVAYLIAATAQKAAARKALADERKAEVAAKVLLEEDVAPDISGDGIGDLTDPETERSAP